MIVIVMGVSASGKTTIGVALAERLGIPFYDADDFHPPANVEKMSRGKPLNDADRAPWLDALHALLEEHADTGRGCVLACSALKDSYRRRLTRGIENHVHLLYLKADYDTIHRRIVARTDHFMPPGLLRSQFDALEEPGPDTLVADGTRSIDEVVEQSLRLLNNAAADPR